MRSLVVLSLFCIAVLAVPAVCEDDVEADTCSDEVCLASSGCRCSSSKSPLSDDQEVPQVRIVIILTLFPCPVSLSFKLSFNNN